MILQKLYDKGLIHPPKFLLNNSIYLAVTGSQAYGIAHPDSDWDIYGFAIPSKQDLFPHLRGEIQGFGTQKKRFDQWTEAHITDPDDGKEYDFTVYNIIRYFQLCMENNPNMVDSLFVPANCVLHSTSIGEMIREQRRIFLHKGCWPKFKGYAFSQLHKMKTKDPDPNSKRAKYYDQFGYDVKFATNVVRLLDEVEQILTLGDLDLQRAKDVMKAVRYGEWTMQQVEDHFVNKEATLEKAYAESKLEWGPDEAKIKQLLLSALEHHYGNLSDCVVDVNKYEQAIHQITEIVNKISK